jgi:hypothetical protein
LTKYETNKQTNSNKQEFIDHKNLSIGDTTTDNISETQNLLSSDIPTDPTLEIFKSEDPVVKLIRNIPSLLPFINDLNNYRKYSNPLPSDNVSPFKINLGDNFDFEKNLQIYSDSQLAIKLSQEESNNSGSSDTQPIYSTTQLPQKQITEYYSRPVIALHRATYSEDLIQDVVSPVIPKIQEFQPVVINQERKSSEEEEEQDNPTNTEGEDHNNTHDNHNQRSDLGMAQVFTDVPEGTFIKDRKPDGQKSTAGAYGPATNLAYMTTHLQLEKLYSQLCVKNCKAGIFSGNFSIGNIGTMVDLISKIRFFIKNKNRTGVQAQSRILAMAELHGSCLPDDMYLTTEESRKVLIMVAQKLIDKEVSDALGLVDPSPELLKAHCGVMPDDKTKIDIEYALHLISLYAEINENMLTGSMSMIGMSIVAYCKRGAANEAFINKTVNAVQEEIGKRILLNGTVIAGFYRTYGKTIDENNAGALFKHWRKTMR